MKDAVIVSTARTPIGKAYRGAFNDLSAPTLGASAVAAAVERAGIEAQEVDDVIMGCALQQGSSGGNIARQVALRAGLPVTVSGMSIDRRGCNRSKTNYCRRHEYGCRRRARQHQSCAKRQNEFASCG